MKITDISLQARNNNRVNVSIDGVYSFSLDIAQVTDLNLKVGCELSDGELKELQEESQFGKLYMRALEYCLRRPHSVKEVRDYLWRKTQPTLRKGQTGMNNPVVYSERVASRVLSKLQQKAYVNDDEFARWWVENRQLSKGVSQRKLTAELRSKGVHADIIAQTLEKTDRTDEQELRKVIAKKHRRYAGDRQKFVQYLVRQGFSYDDVVSALNDVEEVNN
jgi:recX family